jgi:hypothetical protein
MLAAGALLIHGSHHPSNQLRDVAQRYATDTLVAGHSALARPALRIGVDTTIVFVAQNGARRRSAASTSTVTRQGDNYVIVQQARSPKGAIIDTIEVDAATLAPRRHVEVFPWLRSDIRYSASRVTGSYTDSTGTHDVAIALSAPVFDFSTAEQVLSILPRTSAYEAVIRTFDVSARVEKTIKVRVGQREPLEWNGSTVDVTTLTMDFGAWQVATWLADDGRRLQWKIQRGAMEMIGVVQPGG